MSSSLTLSLCITLFGPLGQTRTSSHTAEGLTLTISSDCRGTRAPCPFRAEINGAADITRMIERVDYTHVPHQRSPVSVRHGTARFVIEGVQSPGELVYAQVIVRQQGSGRLKTVALEAPVPFAAEVHPSLPAGLRFEDSYQQQYLEGGIATGYYRFRIWLRGEPDALKRIRSVDYRLPGKYFSQGTVRGRSDMQFFLDGTAPNREKWDIVAVIRWTDGRISTHRIPFQPQ